MKPRTFIVAMVLLLAWGAAGCAHVQVLRLTTQTFSPREVEDVEILSQYPSESYQKIAELSETSSSNDLETLQEHLLEKGAELGADAVVFAPSITHTEQRVSYQPAYSPWGYYAPYYYGPGAYGYWGPWGYRYGPWGPAWGYRYTAPLYYSVHVTTLKGTAIRLG